MAGKVQRGYAVIHAAVLVIAVIGGATTLVGTVTAEAQHLTVTNEGQTVQPGGTLKFEVTDDVSLNETDVQVWIDSVENGVYDPSERNKTLDSNAGSTLNDSFQSVDLSTGRYTLMAVENASLHEGQQPQTIANFTVDSGPPIMVSAVAFAETAGTQAHGDVDDTVVEVMFNESLSDGTGGTAPTADDITVELSNGSVANATLNDGGPGDAAGDRRVVLNLGSAIDPPDVGSIEVNTGASFTDTAGNRVISTVETARTASTTVAQNGDNTTAFIGETVAIVGDVDDEDIYIKDSKGDIILDNSTGVHSKVFVWDTGTQSTDRDYYIMFDGRTQPDFLLGGDVSLTLEKLGLTVRARSTQLSPDENLTVRVSTNVANRTIEARLRKNGSRVASTTRTLNGTEATLNFGPQDSGDYTVRVVDTKTGLTATTVPIHVLTPTPTSTPTMTPTPSPTPTVTATPTTVPTPTRTPVSVSSPTPTDSTPSDGYEMITPPPTPTPTQTLQGPGEDEPGPETPSPQSPNDIVDFLGLIWDGATDSVGAVLEAIDQGLADLLP